MQEHIKKYFDVKRSGHNAIAKCPFHADSSPSLYIYPNNYHCFSCNAHGNVIDFEIHHKNISFREAVLELSRQYQIDIIIENENNKNPNQAKFAKLISQAEDLQKKFRKNFIELNHCPIRSFLEEYFTEVGFLESVDVLQTLESNTIKALEFINNALPLYSFPFQTERGEIFGFLFIQLEMEPSLKIPIEKSSFTFALLDQFQRVVNFPQARRHITERSLVVATTLFDLCFLLKHNIKNSVLVQEQNIGTGLYSYFSKYTSKIFLILTENSTCTGRTYDGVTILTRWIPKLLSEKIDCYQNINSSDTIGQWILGAQKLQVASSLRPIAEDVPANTNPNANKDDINLFRKASDFYHRILLHPSSAHVVDYLKMRELSLDDIQEWKLGFCPRDSILTKSLLKQKIDVLPFISLGLMRISHKTKRLYDFFYDRVVIPIDNHAGDTVALGGRILERSDTPVQAPKYINSIESSLFSKSHILFNFFKALNAIVSSGYAIIVEGYMDCITLVKHGIKNVVAVMGTALTGEHLASLFQITKRAILCFDTDSAGRQAIKKSFLANFKFPELVLETVELPLEKDPDAYVKKYGSGEFLKIIENNTIPVYENVIQSIQKQSQDMDEFISRLKFEFRYIEYSSESVLGKNIASLLMQKYDINAQEIFVKNSVIIHASNAHHNHMVPAWSLIHLLELKIIFSFFYCKFTELPKNLVKILSLKTEDSMEVQSEIFHTAFKNQISEIGKQILKELYLFCQQKFYCSCNELSEKDVLNFAEHTRTLAAYLKSYSSILLSVGADFLINTQSNESNSSSLFDRTQVWSPKNVSFLRLQHKNAELSKDHNRLTCVLVESLAQIEIDEIDSQLKNYSKTHFNHDIKEKFTSLMQARGIRQLLLIGWQC